MNGAEPPPVTVETGRIDLPSASLLHESTPLSNRNHSCLLARLARGIQRGVISSLFRRATRRVHHGLTVGIVTGSFDVEVAFDRMVAGLDLLAHYEPSIVARLRHDAKGILVWEREISSGVASWHFGIKLIFANARFLCDPETTSADVAAMLVHEATHARLDRLGYGSDRRARIEALCFRRERAFARRLPDSQGLLEEIERQLQRDPSYWADTVHLQRVADELTKLGVPAWVIRVIQRVSRRRAAER